MNICAFVLDLLLIGINNSCRGDDYSLNTRRDSEKGKFTKVSGKSVLLEDQDRVFIRQR